MGERWFFALWPDVSVSGALAELRPASLRPGVRWTHPSDLHLTLVFLGELTPSRLSCAEGVADRVRGSPVSIRLDSLGAFRRSRVVWCGPSRITEPLLGLVERLQAELGQCGIEPETRPYRAHVTLARGVSESPAPFAFDPVDWVAPEFVLACGRSGQRPRYEIRRRWALAEWCGTL